MKILIELNVEAPDQDKLWDLFLAAAAVDVKTLPAATPAPYSFMQQPIAGIAPSPVVVPPLPADSVNVVKSDDENEDDGASTYMSDAEMHPSAATQVMPPGVTQPAAPPRAGRRGRPSNAEKQAAKEAAERALMAAAPSIAPQPTAMPHVETPDTPVSQPATTPQPTAMPHVEQPSAPALPTANLPGLAFMQSVAQPPAPAMVQPPQPAASAPVRAPVVAEIVHKAATDQLINEDELNTVFADYNSTPGRIGDAHKVMKAQIWPEGDAKGVWFTAKSVPADLRGRLVLTWDSIFG